MDNNLQESVSECSKPMMLNEKFAIKSDLCMPSVNVYFKESVFLVEIAIPGIEKGDFKIKVEDKKLYVNIDKLSDDIDKGEILRKEFSYSQYSRAFILPDDTDVNKINANYSRGILLIQIPKIAVE